MLVLYLIVVWQIETKNSDRSIKRFGGTIIVKKPTNMTIKQEIETTIQIDIGIFLVDDETGVSSSNRNWPISTWIIISILVTLSC